MKGLFSLFEWASGLFLFQSRAGFLFFSFFMFHFLKGLVFLFVFIVFTTRSFSFFPQGFGFHLRGPHLLFPPDWSALSECAEGGFNEEWWLFFPFFFRQAGQYGNEGKCRNMAFAVLTNPSLGGAPDIDI